MPKRKIRRVQKIMLRSIGLACIPTPDKEQLVNISVSIYKRGSLRLSSCHVGIPPGASINSEPPYLLEPKQRPRYALERSQN
jgi:hypothetical protein